MVTIPPATTLLSEAILIGLIALVLFVMFKMGRFLFGLVAGLVMNSILGIIAIIALNSLFKLAIPISQLYVLIPTALFGLPAVATFVILKYFGVALAILI